MLAKVRDNILPPRSRGGWGISAKLFILEKATLNYCKIAMNCKAGH